MAPPAPELWTEKEPQDGTDRAETPLGPSFGSFRSLGRGRVLLGGQQAAWLWKQGCVSHPLLLPAGLPGWYRSSRAAWWGADFARRGCYAAVGVRVPRGTAPASHGQHRHVSHVQAVCVSIPRGPRLPASRWETVCVRIPRGPRARVPPREQLRVPVPAPFPPRRAPSGEWWARRRAAGAPCASPVDKQRDAVSRGWRFGAAFVRTCGKQSVRGWAGR